MDGNPAPLMGALTSVPPVKRRRAKDRNSPYPFEDMARLAKTNPGKPLLAAESVPLNKIKSVREYRGDPFEDATGRIQVEMRNSRVVDNKRYGDVYLTWIYLTRQEAPKRLEGRSHWKDLMVFRDISSSASAVCPLG
ncbi:hypothetical protein ACIPVK_18815 [Paeniglutamicibacter sp. MACA_103]|uniref:hypothetical protein n=1 Tax=Paeniglutamicibacter sp. MACA_103 TaxID=3377337 RepID=UPI003894FAC9